MDQPSGSNEAGEKGKLESDRAPLVTNNSGIAAAIGGPSSTKRAEEQSPDQDEQEIEWEPQKPTQANPEMFYSMTNGKVPFAIIPISYRLDTDKAKDKRKQQYENKKQGNNKQGNKKQGNKKQEDKKQGNNRKGTVEKKVEDQENKKDVMHTVVPQSARKSSDWLILSYMYDIIHIIYACTTCALAFLFQRKGQGKDNDNNKKKQEKAKKKGKYPGMENVERFILAFINHMSGGELELADMEPTEDAHAEGFDNHLVDFLVERGQNDKCGWIGKNQSRLNPKRRIFVKPTEGNVIQAYQSYAFERLQDRNLPMITSTKIIKRIRGEGRIASFVELQPLPQEVIFGEQLYPEDIVNENKCPTVGMVTFDNDKHHVLRENISSLANTNGGHLCYGVDDKSLEVKGIKLGDDEAKTRANINNLIQKMVWISFTEATPRRMTEKEISHCYKIKFIPIKKPQNGKNFVLVVTVNPPRGLFVCLHQPIVPVLGEFSDTSKNVIQSMDYLQWFGTLVKHARMSMQMILPNNATNGIRHTYQVSDQVTFSPTFEAGSHCEVTFHVNHMVMPSSSDYRPAILQGQHPSTDQPKFNTRFSDKQVHEGDCVSFSCTISAHPEARVSWQKNDTDVDTTRCKASHEGNQYQLVIDNVVEGDGGVYKCIAENSAGPCVCSATLTVMKGEAVKQKARHDPIEINEELSQEDQRKQKTEGLTDKPDVMAGAEPPPPDIKEFLIEKSSVEFGDIIGRGGFSSIYAVNLKTPSGNVQLAAAKKVRGIQAREVQVMKELNHKHVITFNGIYNDGLDTYIIMERATNGDLRNYLSAWREKEKRKLPVNLARKWSYEAACGVEYLHSLQYTHRDIKSLNYLIAGDMTLKLGDLGLAKVMAFTQETSGQRGTCRWMAPEVIKEQKRTIKSDVYSFGVVVWEIITTAIPFKEMRGDFQVMNAVCMGKRPAIPDDCPQDLREIIQVSWQDDYHNRPTMEQIRKKLEQSVQTEVKCEEVGKQFQELLSAHVQVQEEDTHLRNLANQLGHEWKELATNLGFRSDEVDRICMDHPRTSERIYAVLTQWRNRLGAGVDANSLLEKALKKSGRHDLAVKIKGHLDAQHSKQRQQQHSLDTEIDEEQHEIGAVEHQQLVSYFQDLPQDDIPMLSASPHTSRQEFLSGGVMEQGGTNISTGDIVSMYRMCHHPRGICLIINNEDFSEARAKGCEQMYDRQGSHVDRDKLDMIFTKFKFTIQHKANLKTCDMFNALDDVRKEDQTHYDAFVCCILTHGRLGELAGCDGKYLSIQEILSLFTAEKCPGLIGKPKIFFIQACQGQDSHQKHNLQIDAPTPPQAAGIGAGLEQTIPNHADFLLGFASVPGHVSYRSTVLGSWYISILVDKLEKLHEEEDLMSILTAVNNKLSKESAKIAGGEYGQIPAPVTTLRKKLYFPSW